MKANKMSLSLEKINITKLQNPQTITGGEAIVPTTFHESFIKVCNSTKTGPI